MVPMFLVHKVMVPHGGSFTQSPSIPHDRRLRTKSAERCDLLHQDTPTLLAHPIITVLHYFRYIHRFTCFSRTVPDRIFMLAAATFYFPLAVGVVMVLLWGF